MNNTDYDQTRPLAEQVAERLKEYILKRKLKSGDKLPTEAKLSVEMNVARSTVREAIKRLESQNILTVRHGAGSFVADNTGLTEDPLGLAFFEDKWKLTEDLLEIRTIIEPAIAELAARNATAEDIAELDRLYPLMEKHILNGEDYLKEDIQFHKAISKASGNLVVPNLTPIITTAVQLFTEETHRKLLQETLETHRAVLEAIRNRDSVSAKDAMVLHLSYNRNYFRQMMRERAGLPVLAPTVPSWVLELDELKKPEE